MDSQKPGVILVHDEDGSGGWLDQIEQRFVDLGFEVIVPNSLRDENSGAFLPDRKVQAVLEASLAELGARKGVDEDRISVMGFGVGGTHAYLLACMSCNVASLISFQSPMVYGELSAIQPVQPLEMTLNMSAPLLAFYSESTPELREGASQLALIGSQFAKDFDIVSSPDTKPQSYRSLGSTDVDDELHAQYVKDCWIRVIAFLREHLELPELGLDAIERN